MSSVLTSLRAIFLLSCPHFSQERSPAEWNLTWTRLDLAHIGLKLNKKKKNWTLTDQSSQCHNRCLFVSFVFVHITDRPHLQHDVVPFLRRQFLWRSWRCLPYMSCLLSCCSANVSSSSSGKENTLVLRVRHLMTQKSSTPLSTECTEDVRFFFHLWNNVSINLS